METKLEEDIKKDLKEIKEEVEEQKISTEEVKGEKSETKEVSEESKKGKKLEEDEVKEEKSDITPEKVEGLVEKLIKSEEEKKEEEAPEKKFTKPKLKEIFFISGSILILIFIILGIWIGLKLIKGEFNKEKEENIKKLSESEVVIPESAVFKKFTKLVITANKKEEEYPYKLELKNFLIPLGLKEFLSLDVFLYFGNNTSLKEITEKELDFREILYSYLKTISADTWKNSKGIQILEEKIKEKLEKEKIKPLPQKIRLEGVILKG